MHAHIWLDDTPRFIVTILILSEYPLLFSVLLFILVTTVIKDQTRSMFSNDRRPPTLVPVLGAPSDNVEILVPHIVFIQVAFKFHHS